MKHVLHLASWYPNRTSPQAGDFIQRHLQALSALMPVHVIFVVKDAGMQTRVERSTTRRGNLTETIIYYKPITTGISAVDRLISFRRYSTLLKKATFKYIRNSGRPDLVHVHVAMQAGVGALYLWRTFGIPFLVTEHWSGYYTTDPDNYFSRNKLFRAYTAKIFRNAWRVTAVSADLAKKLTKIFGARNASVLYNVVDTTMFFYRPPAAGIFEFIHISNMHPIKNPEGIFRVLSRLKKVRSDWSVLLVGDIDQSFRELALRLGIDQQLQWTGSVDHEAVPALISRSRALLMFSHHENLSCVVCESICSGVPVIATAVGGLPEIINSANGLLCKAGDEDALLALMLEMLDEHQRFNQPQIAAAAGALFAEPIIANRFIDLYNGR